jgi:hypothetical protein
MTTLELISKVFRGQILIERNSFIVYDDLIKLSCCVQISGENQPKGYEKPGALIESKEPDAFDGWIALYQLEPCLKYACLENLKY